MPRHLEAVLKMPLMTLPLRSTLIEHDGARVLLVPASTVPAEEYRALGPVTDIVAPNLYHLDGVPKAAVASPKARLWGPIGAKEKLPSVAWGGILGRDPWPHDAGIAHVEMKGMPKFAENVFVDRASRTLVAGDLVFNITEPKGAGAWIVLNAFGTHGRFAASRLFFSMVNDRGAFLDSTKQLLTHAFERVVPAHGAIVEADGKAKLEAALRERGVAI